MKNQVKPRGLVCLQMASLDAIEYSQWKYRVKRAISSQIKNNHPKLDDKDRYIILGILVGINDYFSNDYIIYINEVLDMTLPTWTETRNILNQRKFYKYVFIC